MTSPELVQFVGVIVAGISIVSLVGGIARRIGGPSRRSLKAERYGMSLRDDDAQQSIASLEADVESLRAELAQMRARFTELDDVQNRLDFAERMLAQVRDRSALPGPR